MPETAKGIKLEDIIEIVFRRRWWIIFPFCFSMIVGICLMFVLPKYYQGQTLILIQPPKVPANYVQSVVTTDIDSRLDAFSRQILSRSNLEKIMIDFKMYTEPKYNRFFVEDKIADMRNRILVELLRREVPGGRGYNSPYAFTISYRDKDPEKAMKVTNALASYFIDENLRFREAEATGTLNFLEEELNPIREDLVAKEKELKEFREKYMGGLPEQLNSNLGMLTQLQEQLKVKQTSLLDAKNKLAMIMNQIQEGALLFGQDVMVNSDGGIEFNSGKSLNLDQAKAMLSYLETRYTKKHPDIIRIKKIITELEKKNEKNKETSNELQYIPLNSKMQFEQINTDINTLKANISKLESQIRDYEKRIENTPNREQELLLLKRDYDNVRASYDLLLNKQLETEISANMEKKQKGEKFQILELARLPEKPVFPNMKILFILIFAAGLGAVFGLVFLLEYSDTSFRSPKDIESNLGFPVFATIPLFYDQKHKRKQRFSQVLIVVSIMFSCILLSAFAVLSFVGVDQTMELLSQIMAT